MNNYFDSYKKSDCNGCGVCALICPKKAITMLEDEEGFLYPSINKKLCISCGLCKKRCPNNPADKYCEQTYIAVNKDTNVLKDSTSGGIFTIIAHYVLDRKGVVFGVKYDDNLKVVHDYIESVKNLKFFRHVKYVRSDLNNSYLNVERFLKDGRYVLFTGTPCQCAGLRAYLNKEYEKLITCEIICHANASPKVFEMFKNNIKNKYNLNIKKIIFRNKSNYGWRSGSHTDIIFSNNYRVDEPSFANAFLHELINRPSCYNCRFCTTFRYSDFTIGDMWGIEKIDSMFKDNNLGLSLINVNTDKGRKIFNIIKNNMNYEQIDTKLAFSYNHNSNINYHINRRKFFNRIANQKINEKNIISELERYTSLSFFAKIKRKIIFLLNKK